MQQFTPTSHHARILLVEDDHLLRRVLQITLERAQYIVTLAASFEEAVTLLQRHAFDLLLTDMQLGEHNGIELIELARKRDHYIATIILTGYGTLEAAVQAMRSGVNSFLLKPTPVVELLESVESVLLQRQQRQQHLAVLSQLQESLCWLMQPRQGGAGARGSKQVPNGQHLEIDGLSIDIRRREARRAGVRISLSAGDYAILEYLATRAEEIVTAQDIVRNVLKYQCEPREASNLIKSRIYEIRKKIEDDPSRPRFLINVRGAGYMLTSRRF
jgi:DNA-binding response OmpR family regulator